MTKRGISIGLVVLAIAGLIAIRATFSANAAILDGSGAFYLGCLGFALIGILIWNCGRLFL